MRFEDAVRRMGFYAVRVVTANSEAAAIATAIEVVKNDDELKGVLVHGKGHLGDFTGEVEREVDRMPPKSEERTGFIYFHEDNTD